MPAIPDVITIIGSSYYQPIADLVDKLIAAASRRQAGSESSHAENGYAAACVVLLVALLESFTARVRFKRGTEIKGTPPVPDLIATLFPSCPTNGLLHEVFLLRNIVAHNHVWHLDVSQGTENPKTLAEPRALGFSVNKNYESLVDVAALRTVTLNLSATPDRVGVSEVRAVFETVWLTLEHMNSVSFDHTPLAGRQVSFRGSRVAFESLGQALSAVGGSAA